jgi:flagellar FliL protein
MKGTLITQRVFRSLVSLLLLLAGAGVASAADDEGPAEIAYFEMKPSIVANLTGGPKYIRCDIQLMTEQASRLAEIQLHAPALRHHILMLMAGRDGSQLKTRDGKEGLRQAALEAIRAQMEALTGSPVVKDLYFTAYYVK